MGWVKSPPYFCAATETARDVTTEYMEAPVGTLATQKFEKYVTGDDDYVVLPEHDMSGTGFAYIVEVYMDDFMSLVILILRDQL
jgi:hypothetical protein